MNMHVFLCFTEICIPFLVLEGLHPSRSVCILIKWIRLYRRMKRERTEIGEYRFWVSHLFLLCSVCLSFAEYSHCMYMFVSLHVSSSSRGCITHGHYPFDVRRNFHSSMSVSCKILHRRCHHPSSYNLHRRIHILVLVSSIRFRHETNTNRSSLHF